MDPTLYIARFDHLEGSILKMPGWHYGGHEYSVVFASRNRLPEGSFDNILENVIKAAPRELHDSQFENYVRNRMSAVGVPRIGKPTGFWESDDRRVCVEKEDVIPEYMEQHLEFKYSNEGLGEKTYNIKLSSEHIVQSNLMFRYVGIESRVEHMIHKFPWIGRMFDRLGLQSKPEFSCAVSMYPDG